MLAKLPKRSNRHKISYIYTKWRIGVMDGGRVIDFHSECMAKLKSEGKLFLGNYHQVIKKMGPLYLFSYTTKHKKNEKHKWSIFYQKGINMLIYFGRIKIMSTNA